MELKWNLFEWFAAKKDWIWQFFFIDWRFWMFLVLSGTFLFVCIRYQFAEKAAWKITFQKEFFLPLMLLLGSWAATYYVLHRPVKPLDDGKVHLTITEFGTDSASRLLAVELNDTLGRLLRPLSQNVEFRSGAIPETVRDESTAKYFGTRRGLHIVVFGEVIQVSKDRYYVHKNILQAYPYKGINLGMYQWQDQVDLSNLRDLRETAKDIILKVFRLCEQHEMLEKDALATTVELNLHVPGRNKAAFDVGDNLIGSFSIGENKEGQPFLDGIVDEVGNFMINGRLYDSDGRRSIEIVNGASRATEGFEVTKFRQDLAIKDGYGRELLLVRTIDRTEEVIQDFSRRFQEAYHGDSTQPVPSELTEALKALKGLRRITIITGELYDKDGHLRAIIHGRRLFLNNLRFGF